MHIPKDNGSATRYSQGKGLVAAKVLAKLGKSMELVSTAPFHVRRSPKLQ
jgi:hypothetical protein